MALAGWVAYVALMIAMWLSPNASSAPPDLGLQSEVVGGDHTTHGLFSSAPPRSQLIAPQMWHVLMWVPMVAMMAPWISYNIRFVTTRTPARRRARAGLEVAVAWTFVWLIALVPLAFASDLLRTALGESWALVLSVAGAAFWQLTPWKRRALLRCDRTMAPPLDARAARHACLTFGARLGWWCVVSDWAFMLVMGAAHHHVLVVVGLLAVSWFERFRLPHHDRRSAETGLFVTAIGAAAVTLALVQV
ncbi:copper chaperone [Microbacterium sp. P5_E9]